MFGSLLLILALVNLDLGLGVSDSLLLCGIGLGWGKLQRLNYNIIKVSLGACAIVLLVGRDYFVIQQDWESGLAGRADFMEVRGEIVKVATKTIDHADIIIKDVENNNLYKVRWWLVGKQKYYQDLLQYQCVWEGNRSFFKHSWESKPHYPSIYHLVGVIPDAYALTCQRLQKQQQSYLARKISNIVTKVSRYPSGGIILALVLGRSEFNDLHDKSLYMATGTSHLLAVSGLHLSLVTIWLRRLVFMVICAFKPIRQGRWLPIVGESLTIIPIYYYMLVLDFRDSIVRAGLLWIFSVGGKVLVLPLRIPDLLGLVAFLSSLYDPMSFARPSWILSYYAVLWLIIIDKKYAYHKWWYNFIQGAKHQMIYAIALAPLPALMFHSICPASIIANIFAIPIFSLCIIPLALLVVIFTYFDCYLCADVISYIFTACYDKFLYFLDYWAHLKWGFMFITTMNTR